MLQVCLWYEFCVCMNVYLIGLCFINEDFHLYAMNWCEISRITVAPHAQVQLHLLAISMSYIDIQAGIINGMERVR